MPNLEQILGRFFTYAKDRQRSRFKALTVTAAINDVQTDFNRKTGLYRLRQSLPIAAGVVDLTNLSAAELGGPVLRLEDLAQNSRRIDPISVDELDNLGNRDGAEWRTAVDPPIEHWLQGLATGAAGGAMTVHVWPFVTVANPAVGVDVHYAAMPPELRARDAVPVLPPTYHIALVWGVLEMLMGDAAKSDDDRDIAAGASKRYRDLVADGQAEVLRWQTG